MEQTLEKGSIINILNIEKKAEELTLKDIEELYYKNKIITLLKFINDDKFILKLTKEE